MSQDLIEFIKSNPNPRELKRALAVKLSIEGVKYKEIVKLLQVSLAFISKWKQAYIIEGIEGLKLRHQGSKGHLNQAQKREVFLWLKQNQNCKYRDLKIYIQTNFKITYSRSSYYRLINLSKK